MSLNASIRKGMRRRVFTGGPRFITFSCERRLPLLGHPEIRDVFAHSLEAARATHQMSVFAWVAMPEHVHLLVMLPNPQSLDRALLGLKLSVAQRIIRRWRQINAPILNRIRRPDGAPRFWQKGGGFDREVRTQAEFAREFEYIHNNPVTRGLVSRPKDWKWSSAQWWDGDRAGVVCCDECPY